MAQPDTAIRPSPKAQSIILDYVNGCKDGFVRNYNLRARMQVIDRQYQRETDYTAAQRRAHASNNAGDADKVQNPVVPVVMPQVETALDTLRDIFLSSYPLFPVVSGPKLIDAAVQMEAVIGEESVTFGWAAELLASMRDGLKYNLMATEVEWTEIRTWAIGNDAQQNVKSGVATETQFAGNKLRRLDPYNLILDTRVPPHEQHTRGEFAGYTELISAIELKQRFADMDPTLATNKKEAFESGSGVYTTAPNDAGYFVPQINPQAMVDPTVLAGATNWDAWARLEQEAGGIQYSGTYEYTVLYARILPSLFGIPGAAPKTPQIYKFVIINRKVVVLVERKTNAHNYLPIVVAQPLEDGTGWQAKSLADNAIPYQQIATALWTSGIESQRRKVYDRIFYDPSRINKRDIDNVSSVARIPIKTEAYGKPVTEAFAVVPYRDEAVGTIFQVAQSVTEMADVANGQNRVQRGQFQKGNKTRFEFEQTMNNGDSRPRMTAIVLEARYFTPIKQIIKTNILQYQPPTKLYDRKTNAEVQIDPVQLRNFSFSFKLADGLMPTSQIINMETFQALFNAVGQNPMIGAEYDVVGAFFYWLKLQGASWIDDFKIQQPTTGAVPQQPGAVPTQMPPV